MKRLLCHALFCVLILFAHQAHALTSGTTTTGSIAAGGTSNQSFSGTAGKIIALNANAAYSVKITVYKPDGSFLVTGNDRVSASLPAGASGTYSVVLSATNSTDSGSYSLAYVISGGSVSNGSLTSGQTATDTLSANGIKSYQFTGTAAQIVALNTASSYTMGVLYL